MAVVLPSGAVRVTTVDSGHAHDLTGPPASAVTFAGDALLVQRQDNNLEVWNATGTRILRIIPGDARYAEGMTAVPHTGLVARVTEEGSVELSELDSGQLLGSFPLPLPARSGGEPPWDATALAASPDGQELITATSAGSIIGWQLTANAWIRAACAAAGRDLTPDEWRSVVGTVPPASLSCLGNERPHGAGGSRRIWNPAGNRRASLKLGTSYLTEPSFQSRHRGRSAESAQIVRAASATSGWQGPTP